MKAFDSPNHIPELLSPAGEPDSFFGAINAGADAVYLAGEKFGARAYAQNFDTNTLVQCIHYAHLMQKKVYLTVNTLFKESELEQLIDYMLPFYEAGLDAVIVQDLGVFKLLKMVFPEMELHISTQMTICSEYGAQLLKDMGASRIVPARELSLQEIKTIKENVDIELETFIHGAMCYCYSGQCLFSSILGGRSGNRGRCAQPCRLPYQVTCGSNTSRQLYPLSLKDMCTIDHLPQLIEAGIDSFKIEGRMKKPEYAAGVTDIYRRAMDRYFELRESYGIEEAAERFACTPEDRKHLSSLYIRSEVQDGYYFKHNGKEMITLESPSYVGGEEELLSSFQDTFLQHKKRLPIEMSAKFLLGLPAAITLRHKEFEVHVEGDVVEKAQKVPLTEENIRKQLNKFGETWFTPETTEIQMDETVFYSLKALNELRREACTKLLDVMTKFHRRNVQNPLYIASNKVGQSQMVQGEDSFSILVSDFTQMNIVHKYLQRATDNKVSRIYIELDCLLKHEIEMMQLCRSFHKCTELWVALPYILRKQGVAEIEKLSELKDLLGISGLLVRTVDQLGLLAHHPLGALPIRCDAGVYTWNHLAHEQLSMVSRGFTIPYELNSKEQGKLLQETDPNTYEKILYGRIPMMITANCVLRTTGGCDKNNTDRVSLIDRYHKEFPVVRNCSQCYNVILNTVPLWLTRPSQNTHGINDYRLNFTVEDEKTMLKVLEYYLGDGKNSSQMMNSEHTTGHEKRGVE